MKSIRLAITAICLTLSPHIIAAGPLWEPIVPFGVIKGVVYNADTGDAVPWASVEVFGVTPLILTPDGTFIFYMIPPGNYTVKARNIGYHGQFVDVVAKVGRVIEVAPRIKQFKWYDRTGGQSYSPPSETPRRVTPSTGAVLPNDST